MTWQARFLSHWCPPPLLTACSLAVWDRERHLLVRSYDYPPLLCDTTVLASTWAGTRVVAMTDCVWGAVDGVNEHGLAVAIAFGGRPVVGTGFGIGLVVRYVLQVARDVREALEVLARVPVQLAYNVALTDASGGGAIAMVGPDRPMTVMAGAPRATGRARPSGPSTRCSAPPRSARRRWSRWSRTRRPRRPPSSPAFLAPPLYRDPATTVWGTVYTAAYDCDARTLDLSLARRRLAAVPGRLRPRHPDPGHVGGGAAARVPPAPSADDLLPGPPAAVDRLKGDQ